MRKSGEGALFWAPRILSILFALFLSVFALDVFSESKGILETAVGLLLHLVPTFTVFGLLYVAWRREWIAAVAFGVLGIAYIVGNWGRFPWTAYAAISGPLLLMAVLFLLSWWQRLRARKSAQQTSGVA